MSFTAEISFTGFGYLLLRSRVKQDPSPDSAQILLLRNAPHFPYHWSYLSFRLEDLRSPEGEMFGETSSGPDGSTIAKIRLHERTFVITVDAENDTEFAVDWDGSRAAAARLGHFAPVEKVARLDDDLGIDDLILPGASLRQGPYTGRVVLPKGEIYASKVLRQGSGGPALFSFEGQEGRTTELAEQIVWRRERVRSLTIETPEGKKYVLDNTTRSEWGEEPLLQIAITNLPKDAVSGNDWEPRDLDMFRLVSSSGNVNLIRREPAMALPVTPHSTCPPVLQEEIAA